MSQPIQMNPTTGKAGDLELEYVENVASRPNGYAYQEPGKSLRKTGLERRLVMKLDCLLIPLLALIYFVTFLDRNSFGNGRLLGLSTELHLSDQQYANCAQLFFIGYVIFMLPGNVLLRSVPPWLLIGGATVTFGTLLCCMAAAPNYQTVLALRILIGLAQALVQGIGLYASLWYRRNELATRGAIYFSTATLSGAFSGLIAYAIGKNLTEKATGRAPWRWLFIVEGVIAIFVGLVVVVLLPSFPDKMKKGKNWLFTKEEISLSIERSATFNTQGSRFQVSQILEALKDPKSWAYTFINGGAGMTLSSLGVFLPTFVANFGFEEIDAQLFSAIPYACAFIVLPTLAFISDRVNSKGPFIIGGLTLSAAGYFMLLFANPTVVKIVATCFITCGTYPAVVLSVTWLGINTAGFTKKGATWAMAEIMSQIMAIVASNIYKDPPRYVTGHSVVLAMLVFAIFNALALWLWMGYSNKQRDRILTEYAARGEIHPDEQKSLEEASDLHINFRYVL